MRLFALVLPMQSSVIIGLIRHALTAAGAALVARGLMSEEMTSELVGALTSIVSVGWFLLSRRKPA